MKIHAISDLHINHPDNRALVETLPGYGDDWLLLAGDVAERYIDIEAALTLLAPRFGQIVWTPGNHELWTLPRSGESESGLARYRRLVALFHSFGVLTPEDPYPLVTVGGQDLRIVPLFLLYDYSFRPAEVSRAQVVDWAAEIGNGCTDEYFLGTAPYRTCDDWCRARCEETRHRLEHLDPATPTILVNHFPMVEDFARVPLLPRFTPWCGTRQTSDWHLRYNAKVVVTGHLHTPMTRYRDGVRFEDVSLGYPRQRRAGRPPGAHLRQIWPEPAPASHVLPPPIAQGPARGANGG